jgi:dynein heavy chain
MSAQFEDFANSLFNNQVPELWAQKAYPSTKPLSAWIADLEHRLDFIQGWIKNGLPKVFWISGFFFPQAFLTGALQTFARKYQISIDTLSFDFQVIAENEQDIKSGPMDGVYIRGLFLEGARFNTKTMLLDESLPKELYATMPIIWLKPVTNRKKGTIGFYDCPTYKTTKRAGTLSTTGHSTNFILTIEIPTDKPQQHWIKRGVALICGLSY